MEGYEDTYMGVISQPIDVEQVAVNPAYFDYSTTAYTKDEQEALYQSILESWKE